MLVSRIQEEEGTVEDQETIVQQGHHHEPTPSPTRTLQQRTDKRDRPTPLFIRKPQERQLRRNKIEIVVTPRKKQNEVQKRKFVHTPREITKTSS